MLCAASTLSRVWVLCVALAIFILGCTWVEVDDPADDNPVSIVVRGIPDRSTEDKIVEKIESCLDTSTQYIVILRSDDATQFTIRPEASPQKLSECLGMEITEDGESPATFLLSEFEKQLKVTTDGNASAP